jgi:hypothetical protein
MFLSMSKSNEVEIKNEMEIGNSPAVPLPTSKKEPPSDDTIGEAIC